MQKQHDHCTVEGCGRPHKARGYCQTHYMQFKRGAPVVAEIKTRTHGRAPTCTIEGCGKPEQALGLCAMHYMRVQRHGSTEFRDRSKSLKPCKFPGCDRPLLMNGLCMRHSMRERKWKAFGVNTDRYVEMCESQNWVCAICEEPETSRNGASGVVRELAVDHCHENGHVRALLCSACNTALGLFKDRADLLRKAADYLDSHKALW